MERSEAGEKDLKCSCCGVRLESVFFSPFLALKPSSVVLEITHKGDLMEFPNEAEIEEEPAEGERKAAAFVRGQDKDDVNHVPSIDTIVDSPIDEGRVIPLELIDSICLMENLVVDEQKSMELVASSASIVEITDRGSPQIHEVVDIVEDHSLVHPTKVSIEDFSDEHQSVVVEANPAAISSVVVDDPYEVQASEDENKATDGEANCEISIGSEICDQEQIDPPNFNERDSVPVNQELQSSENCSKVINKDQAGGDRSGSSLNHDVLRMLIRGSGSSHALGLHSCGGASRFHAYSKRGCVPFPLNKAALVLAVGDQIQLSGPGLPSPFPAKKRAVLPRSTTSSIGHHRKTGDASKADDQIRSPIPH